MKSRLVVKFLAHINSLHLNRQVHKDGQMHTQEFYLSAHQAQ